MALISALLSRLLADEFKAWNPRIVHYLIGRAVAQLPKDQRVRYEEEWGSHIGEIPGEFGKLFTAAGFLIAARRIKPINGKRNEIGAIAKRMTDVIGSAFVLLLQAPVLLLIGLVIRLTSKTPMIVTERRVGLRGREFDMLMFGGAGGVKRFLERTSLSHLPQLVNVLRGDMALSDAVISAISKK